MESKENEIALRKGISSCYSQLSLHIHDIVNEQSLSIFCSEQGEYGSSFCLISRNIGKGIVESKENRSDKENIVFNNPSFSSCWKELTHEEDVEIKRSIDFVLQILNHSGQTL